MRDETAWAKAGMSVDVVRNYGRGAVVTTTTIKRITKLMVVLERGTRFWRATGQQIDSNGIYNHRKLVASRIT